MTIGPIGEGELAIANIVVIREPTGNLQVIRIGDVNVQLKYSFTSK